MAFFFKYCFGRPSTANLTVHVVPVTHEEMIAMKVVDRIFTAVKDEDFKAGIDAIIQKYGMNEQIAQMVLVKLEQTLKMTKKAAPVARVTFHKVYEEATGLSRDHVAYGSVIALGILTVLMPCVTLALGFTEGGSTPGE